MSAILKQTARFLFSGLMCPPPKSGAKGGGGQTEQEGPEEQDYEELDEEYGTGCAWNCNMCNSVLKCNSSLQNFFLIVMYKAYRICNDIKDCLQAFFWESKT